MLVVRCARANSNTPLYRMPMVEGRVGEAVRQNCRFTITNRLIAHLWNNAMAATESRKAWDTPEPWEWDCLMRSAWSLASKKTQLSLPYYPAWPGRNSRLPPLSADQSVALWCSLEPVPKFTAWLISHSRSTRPSCDRSGPSDDEVIPSLSCNTRLVTGVSETGVGHKTIVAMGKACYIAGNSATTYISTAFVTLSPCRTDVMKKTREGETMWWRNFDKGDLLPPLQPGLLEVFFVLEESVSEQSPITWGLRPAVYYTFSTTSNNQHPQQRPPKVFKKKSTKFKRQNANLLKNGARYHRNTSKLQLEQWGATIPDWESTPSYHDANYTRLRLGPRSGLYPTRRHRSVHPRPPTCAAAPNWRRWMPAMLQPIRDRFRCPFSDSLALWAHCWGGLPRRVA